MNFTLVLGGARSGKSGFAEKLALSYGEPTGYIATAQAFDSEMESRISQHQIARGDAWITVEEPLEIKSALEKFSEGHVVVIDCLTLWLSNVLHEGRDVSFETSELLKSARACPAHVICVSNELGMGLVPETKLGRDFRDAQGKLNQAVAAEADLVVFVAAGLPMVLKGQLPEGLS